MKTGDCDSWNSNRCSTGRLTTNLEGAGYLDVVYVVYGCCLYVVGTSTSRLCEALTPIARMPGRGHELLGPIASVSP